MCERETTDNSCRRCNERLVRVTETAGMLGIAEKTVRNQMSVRTFPIKHYKLGGRVLFKLSEILKFIDSLE